MTQHHREEEDRPVGWKLDRSISIAVIATVVGQLCVGIWYASADSAELSDHERRISHIENLQADAQTKIAQALSELSERTARIEVQVALIPKK